MKTTIIAVLLFLFVSSAFAQEVHFCAQPKHDAAIEELLDRYVTVQVFIDKELSAPIGVVGVMEFVVVQEEGNAWQLSTKSYDEDTGGVILGWVDKFWMEKLNQKDCG